MRITVVIVDDDEVDRYICKRLLRGAEFETDILEFVDGEPAVRYMVEDGPSGVTTPFPPHVILVDINMPIIDGYAFVERITPQIQAGQLGTAVIMMMSSSSRQEDIDRALAMDAVSDYIVKGTLESEEFQAKILEHVR